MRTIIVVNPDKLNGNLKGVKCMNQPELGERVELEHDGQIFAAGAVSAVKPNTTWVGTWLYDVQIGEQE